MYQLIQIPTTEGLTRPTESDQDHMDYLDGLYDVPGGYGLLLFKADPTAFRTSKEDQSNN